MPEMQAGRGYTAALSGDAGAVRVLGVTRQEGVFEGGWARPPGVRYQAHSKRDGRSAGSAAFLDESSGRSSAASSGSDGLVAICSGINLAHWEPSPACAVQARFDAAQTYYLPAGRDAAVSGAVPLGQMVVSTRSLLFFETLLFGPLVTMYCSV